MIFQGPSPKTVAAIIVLLTWLRTVDSVSVPPDPSYWKAPYALRVISNNVSLNGRTVVPDRYYTKTTSSIYVDTKRPPQEAYTIYPSWDPWATNPPYPMLSELYEDEYHDSSNSTEIILIYGSKPPMASGTPLLAMNVDMGPGVTHYWPAASTVADWKSWLFVWDKENQRTLLRKRGWPEGSTWLASFSTGSRYYIYQWNGSLPDPKAGWGSSVEDIVRSSIAIDLEVVPLWTILASS